nr:MAG: hypothetical protein DIU57_14655 [Pseudomonadota bacterium]
MLEGEILDPETLRAMERLQAELDAMLWLSDSMSVVDIVKEVGRALNEDDPAYAVIPDTRAVSSAAALTVLPALFVLELCPRMCPT